MTRAGELRHRDRSEHLALGANRLPKSVDHALLGTELTQDLDHHRGHPVLCKSDDVEHAQQLDMRLRCRCEQSRRRHEPLGVVAEASAAEPLEHSAKRLCAEQGETRLDEGIDLGLELLGGLQRGVEQPRKRGGGPSEPLLHVGRSLPERLGSVECVLHRRRQLETKELAGLRNRFVSALEIERTRPRLDEDPSERRLFEDRPLDPLLQPGPQITAPPRDRVEPPLLISTSEGAPELLDEPIGALRRCKPELVLDQLAQLALQLESARTARRVDRLIHQVASSLPAGLLPDPLPASGADRIGEHCRDIGSVAVRAHESDRGLGSETVKIHKRLRELSPRKNRR